MRSTLVAAMIGAGAWVDAADLPGALASKPDWWAAVQAEIRRSEYQVTRPDATPFADARVAWQAPNRANDLRTYFLADGLRLVRRTDPQSAWRLDLRWARYGRPGALLPVDPGACVVATNRVEYRRAGFTEWYVNDERGLEQGFDIAAPPAGDDTAPLVLELAVEGGLAAVQSGESVAFLDGARVVVRCVELRAWDAGGRLLPASFHLDGDRLELRVDARGAVYPLTIDPLFIGLSTLACWTASGANAGDAFGAQVAAAGDVNGDGYSDILVGAPGFDTGAADGGRVYLYAGSQSGPGLSPAWVTEHGAYQSGCGQALASAGDVNGDGYDDVVIGIQRGLTPFNGEARVYYGSATGLLSSAAWTKTGDQSGCGFGAAVASAGDVNADGYADLLVGAPSYDNGQSDEGRAYLYLGSASGPATTAAWTAESDSPNAYFGQALGCAGKVNNDAYADVIIGAPWLSNGESYEGRAYLYTGNAGGLHATPLWMTEGNISSHRFASAVGGAGDVNGDGYDDITVGAPDNNNAVYLYYGPSPGATANWMGQAPRSGMNFGSAAGTAGDVNGDGYADLLVGAYDTTQLGAAFVYYGSATGLPVVASWSVNGMQNVDYFGARAAAAGDVNGDGYADVIVGAHGYDTPAADAGRAYVFYGASTGLGWGDWLGGGYQAGAQFGYVVGPAGDVNGDGYDDLVVGAPRFDSGQADEGVAFVFHGASVGLPARAAWTGQIDRAGAQFGFSARGGGDINNDGYDDLIVGAPYFDDSSTDCGRVVVYLGSPSGVNSGANWALSGGPGASHLGYSVAIAGDVTGDGYDEIVIGAPQHTQDYTQEGRIVVYAGSATGVGVILAGGERRGGRLGANLGRSVAAAGDLNGDGFADIAAGADQFGSGSAEGRVFVYFGQSGSLRAIPQTLDGDIASAQFGYSVCGAGNVNGDNYDDLIVGAYGYNSGEAGEGRAYVYLGCSTGISCRAVWTSEVNQAQARYGAAVGGAGDVDGDGFDDVLVGAPRYDGSLGDEGAVFLYRGRPGGVNTGATFRILGAQVGAGCGTSVAGLGDINHDGYADYAVGAPLYDWIHKDAGRVLVFHGGALTPPAGAGPWNQEGNQNNASYGYAVAGVGDVNGDGFADVLVGAPQHDHGSVNEGAAFLYSGSVTGLSTTACWAGEGDQVDALYGWSVAGAGDVNKDGYGDLLVGAPFFDGSAASCGKAFLYHGSSVGAAAAAAWSATGATAGAMSAWSVAGAGDINGDGCDDIAVGAPFAWSEASQLMEGCVCVYTGSVAGVATMPSFTRESNVSGWQLGLGLASGDFNDDGYADLAVGVPGYENGQSGEGAIYVYCGGSLGLAASPVVSECNVASANLGRIIAGAGDVNGDGYDDVLAGYPTYANGQVDEGALWIFYGASGGLGTTPGTTLESNQQGAKLGVAVGSLGDFNGDGYSDLVAGAPSYNGAQTNVGRVLVYFGGAAGPAVSPGWSAEGSQPGAFFGQAVNGAGDVNGDGFCDVIVGAPRFGNGQVQEGAAFVFHGSGAIPAPSAAWIGEGNQMNAGYGTAVDTAGDVNGDGYSDVLVGVPWFDNGEIDEGRVYLYRGSSNGLFSVASWTTECNSAGARFGAAVGLAGDVNKDGFSDVLVGAPGYNGGRGRAYCYAGTSTGLQGTPGWTGSGESATFAFGTSIRGAGDVNGDTYDDVIVGEPGWYNGFPNYDMGRVHVYHGSGAGLQTSPAWWTSPFQNGNRFGAAVGTAGDVNGDRYADIIVGSPGYDGRRGRALVFRGTSGGVDGTAIWQGAGGALSHAFGSSVDTAGDVNGDGYADVVVGAPGAGSDGRGAAYVYHGGSGGMASAPGWSVTGALRRVALGTSVATAGDVNGDGCADVVVGAPGASAGQAREGLAYVYVGSMGGLGRVASWTLEANGGEAGFGASVAPAGDVNGDGYADIIVGAPSYHNGAAGEGAAFVFMGGTLPPESAPSQTLEGAMENEQFGWSAACGDFNADGFADLVVGVPYFEGHAGVCGAVFVYIGSADGLSAEPWWRVEGEKKGDLFGYSVAVLRNAYNRRFDGLIVGAPGCRNADVEDGHVYVYANGGLGFPDLPSQSFALEGIRMRFGESVAYAGDVNGDGWGDFLAGAPHFSEGSYQEGAACLFLGSDLGYPASPQWIKVGGQEGAHLGAAVAGAGDVNGDGYGDILVAAPDYDTDRGDEGRVMLYQGELAGAASAAARVWDGGQPRDRFGAALCGMGDVNGDGYGDVAVSAPLADIKMTDDGQVSIYYGSPSGAGASPGRVLDGDGYERFGSALAAAGDTDGNGCADLLVGAPYQKEGELYEGRVALFAGATNGLGTSPAWMVRSGRPVSYFGATVAAADINGDGYADLFAGGPGDYVRDNNVQGRLDLFYANGGRGLPLLQMQHRGADRIAPGGLAETNRVFITCTLHPPIPSGASVTFEWQVAPFGVNFNHPAVIAGRDVWYLFEPPGGRWEMTIAGLTPWTRYQWRLRQLWRGGRAGPSAGPWMHLATGGKREAVFRTFSHDVDVDRIPNSDEDANHDGFFSNDDADGDGIANYRDTDDDNDGIPSRYEDTNGDGLWSDDWDGDGIPAWLDADETFSILEGVPTATNAVRLSWNTISGAVYQCQISTNLRLTAAWTHHGVAVTAAQSTTTATLTNQTPSRAKFYRVRLTQLPP